MMEPFEQIDVGDKVKHPKFGQGTVMFKTGDGEDAKVTVKFGADVGEKKLLVRYAKLKKIIERPTLSAEPAAEEGSGEASAEAPQPEAPQPEAPQPEAES